MVDRSTIATESSGPAVAEAELSSRPFWTFLLLHVVLWTLLPVLFHPNAPLDVVEEISWGREWQWGYYKHPPLAPWLANAAYLASGGKLWSIFLLSQLCVALCFWTVWKLARELVGETRALAAVVLLEGSVYYNFTSAEFNPNVLQLPLWALVVYCGWKAMNRGSVLYWLLLGVFSGIALLTKYYSAALLVFVGLAILLHSKQEKWKPLLSAVIALCIFLPHLLWMRANDFITLTYAVDRASAKKTLLTHFVYPINFTASQLLAVTLMLIAFFLIYGRPRLTEPARGNVPTHYLFLVVLGPFAITFVLSLLMNWKLRSMWGTPLWTFLPLLLLVCFPQNHRRSEYRRIRNKGLLLAGVMSLAFVIPLTLGPYIHAKPRKALFGGAAMAEHITQSWKASTGNSLKIVAGDTWLAGNVAFYSTDRPVTFTEANGRFSPWISSEQLRRDGAVIVWQGGAELPQIYRAAFPDAEIQQPLKIPWHTRKQVEPVTVYWAIAYQDRN
jgi:4-amino-4-deoxy-L-arabinose transferase-like glycosyltransferase